MSVNGPSRHLRLNTLFPGRSIWEGLGVVALFEELCHWGSALRFPKSTPFPETFVRLTLVNQDKIFRLLLQQYVCLFSPMLSNMIIEKINHLESWAPRFKLLFLCWSWFIITALGEQLRQQSFPKHQKSWIIKHLHSIIHYSWFKYVLNNF